jgi:hypothetical protein
LNNSPGKGINNTNANANKALVATTGIAHDTASGPRKEAAKDGTPAGAIGAPPPPDGAAGPPPPPAGGTATAATVVDVVVDGTVVVGCVVMAGACVVDVVVVGACVVDVVVGGGSAAGASRRLAFTVTSEVWA